MNASENIHLLNLEWDFPQVGCTTIRGYLCAMLGRLWRDKHNFDFKRPFGFSHWENDLLEPLVAAGVFEKIPENHPVEDRARRMIEQREALYALITSLIPLMALPTPASRL